MAVPQKGSVTELGQNVRLQKDVAGNAQGPGCVDENSLWTQSDQASSVVDEHWPARLYGPQVWDRTSTPSKAVRSVQLQKSHNHEVNRAIADFKASKLSLDEIAVSVFQLPTLGPLLRSGSEEVYDGSGVVIVRGLDFESRSLEDIVVMFLGISSYFGEQRSYQSLEGDKLGAL